jgi:hypothetical protein
LIKKNASAITDGLRDRVIVELEIYRQSDEIKIDRLAKQLSKVELAKERTAQYKVLTLMHINGVITLSVRCPDFDQNNNGQVDNLAHLFRFAMCMLGLNENQIRLVSDPTLGREILLPAKLVQVISGINQSSKTSKGNFAGDVYKYKSGIKANLVETLGAIRLLRTHIAQVKKKPGIRKKDGSLVQFPSTTLEDLKAQFNLAAGLTDPACPRYAKTFVLSILAECVKPTNSSFPGGFIHALKERNGVKNSEGVLTLMGHVSKAPSVFKIKQIFAHKVDKDLKSVNYYQFDDKDNPEEVSFSEFRAAACLTLPFISPTSEKPMKEQISESPFTTKSSEVLEYFTSNSDLTDSANLAHAVLTAVKNARNKTALPKHFLNAKQTLVAKFKQPVWRDRDGNTYHHFKEIPRNIREFLGKTYHKSIVGHKRDRSSENADISGAATSGDTKENDSTSGAMSDEEE